MTTNATKIDMTVPSPPMFGELHASFTLSNLKPSDQHEIIFDYGRCEGGVPFFRIESASGPEEQIPFKVTYSETRAGVDHEKGDGPFFLFSSAMDSYRGCIHEARRGVNHQTIEARHVQYSQRYQKVSLTLAGSSIKFSTVGFRPVRAPTDVKGTFRCSDETLNEIWMDGVRTLDMCTVRQGETKQAWDVTDEGTRVFPGHWAPVRQGTLWHDKTITFETRIEKYGASWGVHMVANGLVLCLNAEARTLEAFEGLANQASMMTVIPRGNWRLPTMLSLSEWITVTTIAHGETITVLIGDEQVAKLTDIRLTSILAGDRVNAGSVAFGGPEGWASMYRNLRVTGKDGEVLYKNAMTITEAARVLADFQVGTNRLACTIDGAKRDRACFGGDVFVMGRSIAYSTADFEAWRGSIKLLAGHQTPEGYLGNLSPIQAPEHEGAEPPPTYAFYSLTYALLLVVSIKDYWMHSGDEAIRVECWHSLESLIQFASNFTNEAGLVEAPPFLQMIWFPMGGPISGVSAGLNVAYYDALLSMAAMAPNHDHRNEYHSRASLVKDALLKHLWNSGSQTLKMGSSLPAEGFCQDINAYALTLGLLPSQAKVIEKLTFSTGQLPPAFKGLGHWDNAGVASPYATGFAVEALFSAGEAGDAISLLRELWGVMADKSRPNYSGAHWEAMKLDGSPFSHDVSLVHGWSTWPVFLLPRHLVGLYPRTPGWHVIGVEPVLADIDLVEFSLETPAGQVEISVTLDGSRSRGEIDLAIPACSKALIRLPEGWELEGTAEILGGEGRSKKRFWKIL